MFALQWEMTDTEEWRDQARCRDGSATLTELFFSEQLDDIARPDEKGWDVDPPPLHEKVPVANQLSALAACYGKAEFVHDVVEPPFEKNQQIVAGLPFHAWQQAGGPEWTRWLSRDWSV